MKLEIVTTIQTLCRLYSNFGHCFDQLTKFRNSCPSLSVNEPLFQILHKKYQWLAHMTSPDIQVLILKLDA